MYARKTLPLVFLLLSVFLTQARDLDDSDLIVEISTMKEARAPFQWKEWTVLTYKADRPIRYINAVFAHEDFRELHPYRYNKNGVFILVITTPPDEAFLDYRIVVDGIWSDDPLADNQTIDRNGFVLSRLPLTGQKSEILKTPLLEEGTTLFVMKTIPGSRVNLVGSFNRWDPFMMPLKETKPGYFELTLDLPRGDYQYYYTIDGKRFLDFYNPVRVYDQLGREFSSFSIN